MTAVIASRSPWPGRVCHLDPALDAFVVQRQVVGYAPPQINRGGNALTLSFAKSEYYTSAPGDAGSAPRRRRAAGHARVERARTARCCQTPTLKESVMNFHSTVVALLLVCGVSAPAWAKVAVGEPRPTSA
jgi:hypothetical protein